MARRKTAGVRFRPAGHIPPGVPVATTSPPRVARFRAEIDQPVRALDHFEIVLDDEQRVALLDQSAKDAQEQRHVIQVQSCRRLIKNEQRFFLALVDQPLDKLETLRFASAQDIQRLPEGEIAETHFFLQGHQRFGHAILHRVHGKTAQIASVTVNDSTS